MYNMFRHHNHTHLEVTDAGCSVSGSVEASFRWPDIIEIVAFKRDFFSHDQICIGIRTMSSDGYLVISEEWKGFKDFTSAIENKFEVTNDWWSKVAFPAFVENWTRLWPQIDVDQATTSPAPSSPS
jgi:hypothetical protein